MLWCRPEYDLVTSVDSEFTERQPLHHCIPYPVFVDECTLTTTNTNSSQISLRRWPARDHEQIAQRDLQRDAVITWVDNLPENSDGYERSCTHEVALHILTELLGQIALELCPRHAVQRNRWKILQEYCPIALHRDRIDPGRITPRHDDDAVAWLEVAVAEARAGVRAALLLGHRRGWPNRKEQPRNNANASGCENHRFSASEARSLRAHGHCEYPASDATRSDYKLCALRKQVGVTVDTKSEIAARGGYSTPHRSIEMSPERRANSSIWVSRTGSFVSSFLSE